MPRTRKNRTANVRTEPFWKIGLYIRLSKEDGNEDESESVINQEKILRVFVDKYFEPGNYAIAGVFADDGLTGTDTSRPSFKRLEGCIVRKEVNCMIIKSLARGFRNLADTIRYSKEFFADRASLLTLDLGIDERLKPVIQQYIKFFANKERTQKFYDLEIESFNKSTIEIALMSVLCKSKTASFEEVLRCILTDGDVVDNSYLAEFDKYDLLSAFWQQTDNAFGYFVTEDNEKISNENICIADKKDTDTTKRMFRFRFSFKNKKYNNSQKYYLVAFDDNTDMEVLRHEVMMDIAFADDFGFDL